MNKKYEYTGGCCGHWFEFDDVGYIPTERSRKESKRKLIQLIIVILLLLAGIAQAQDIVKSTFTVNPIVLTDEQKDINVISVSDIKELKLLKEDIKYDYLTDEIIDKQATLEVEEDNKEMRERTGRGYTPYNPNQKAEKIKKIEAEDIPIEIIKSTATTEIIKNPESGIGLTELMAIIAAIGIAFIAFIKIGFSVREALLLITAILLLIYLIYRITKRKKSKKLKEV